MKPALNHHLAVRAAGASAQVETADENDPAGNSLHQRFEVGRLLLCSKSGSGLFVFRKEGIMPGRGPQTFKKRQKEQQRKERQQEKMEKRLARKHESGTPTPDGQEAVTVVAEGVQTETLEPKNEG